MTRLLVSLFAILLTDALLLLGHGLHSILVPFSSVHLGFSTLQISLLTSAYFSGFVISCLTTPIIVRRVGHIRSLVVCATLFAISLLLLGLIHHFALWVILRLVIGIAISGIYMVVESWLNERASNTNRGRLLSIYNAMNLLMMVIGQQLIVFGKPDEPLLFIIAACFILLAIIPVSLTLSLTPAPIHKIRLNIPKVWSHSKLSMLGIIAAGLTTAAFWGLSPLFVNSFNGDAFLTTRFVSSAILGGALWQWPLGKLSDRYRRGIVIMCTASVGAIISFIISWQGVNLDEWGLIILSFLWGGSVMTLHSLCLAHANDRSEPGEFVMLGGVVILTLGIASAVGPPIFALGMNYFGTQKLYFFIGLVLVVFVIIAERARRLDDRVPKTNISPHISTTRTSQSILEMDPRASEKET